MSNVGEPEATDESMSAEASADDQDKGPASEPTGAAANETAPGEDQDAGPASAPPA